MAYGIGIGLSGAKDLFTRHFQSLDFYQNRTKRAYNYHYELWNTMDTTSRVLALRCRMSPGSLFPTEYTKNMPYISR